MNDTLLITDKKRNEMRIAIWLLIMAVLVAIMIIIGGITRLTESGLSMVEWRPLIGALPPLNNAEWQRVFSLYQLSPEYQHINFGMTIEQFKLIFFWEYFHRLWGRLLGIVFIIPFIFFYLQGLIPSQYRPYLIGLAIAGGLQGVIGWWMVSSGLADEPRVSQYRLAVHLSMALAIFSALLWLALNLLNGVAKLKISFPILVLALLYLTIIAGAFVAGMDAGLLYNHYPLMGDGFVPVEYGEAGWLDPFENPASAQFHHRWIALITSFFVIYLGWQCLRSGQARKRSLLMLALVGWQFGLGILTLLNGAPVHLGALHQTGAVLLLSASLLVVHELLLKNLNH